MSVGEVSGIPAEYRNNTCIVMQVGEFRFDVKHDTST